ncbi:GMC oxidoreductase [Cellulomonas sp.]|uniref:GMC oxidoreductase n=1 Tax=Cellulomonas sp. TaxID=40001 RepID=UPI003BA8F51A
MTTVLESDVVIIGSGMGGSTMALGLASQGIECLVLERGQRLPREPENWNPTEVFVHGRYKAKEKWWASREDREFAPGVHYVVGGNTKVFGASLPRFREEDFAELKHADGIAPAWPFSYAEFEPWYGEAERVFGVHGTPGADPTEPWRSGDYPYPALPHEPAVERVASGLRGLGLHPSYSAMAVDLRAGGTCIRCSTCDGFPCMVGAKGDAETRALNPALTTGKARLLDGIQVQRLITDTSGTRVVEAIATRGGEELRIRGRSFVLSAGAVNSAVLLLRSANDRHPDGLANSSGQVGRNYMVHNATFLVAIDPLHRNDVAFQKTLMINDWYLTGPEGFPLGNVQMLGKLRAAMIKGARPLYPTWALKMATDRSWDFYLESEDLPSPDNRVTLGPGGRIDVAWTANNMDSHRALIRETSRALKSIGFPVVITQTMGVETNSHQCGTVVAGNDPATSVLDQYCRTHDVENLFVVDGSYFPSSAAVNPALTIAAQALRVAHEGDVLR